MTAVVGVRNDGDRLVKVKRLEAGGDEVTVEPGAHLTFTVRAHERLLVSGDKAGPETMPEGVA